MKTKLWVTLGIINIYFLHYFFRISLFTIFFIYYFL